MKLDDKYLKIYNSQRPKEAASTLCWAPQKSLYIGLRGNVYTCCYNKTFPIGKYPHTSLHDIWFSKQRLKQQEALQNNDLSLGCQNCKRIIEAGNFKGLPAKNFDQLPLSETGYPSKIDFELSNECNLECIMCRGEFSSAIRRNREQLPPIPSPYNDDFLTELEEFIPQLDNCHFLGGEPFLIPIYEKIWELIRKINPAIRLSVQTNATLITKRTKKLIESMNFDIAVSIDSVEAKNYEQIRKNGKFEKVLENITYLRKTCKTKGTNFTLSYCPMPQNWEELEKIVAFANKLNCKLYFNKVDFPKECSFQSLEENKLEEILNFWKQIEFPESDAIEHYNKSAAEQVISQVFYLIENQISTPRVDSLSEYFEQFRSFVFEKEGKDGESTFQSIKEKLLFILNSFGENKLEAESKILSIDYPSLYEGIRQVDKKHALHLFNSFMLPVPSLNQNDV
ncbi:MAG: radical SAM protein [Flavobacteriales bacterium]|nr:radical SAM protein [Flavobacteriales bacterium]